ncbi:MAG: 2-hydroxyacyl-CoA dehydratase [candidate division Zixibacteria bacterium]|nr:2-hydroxyacyl-CoA dehydratase [Candidatus Tariuqbacter arcticus]
MTEPRQIDFREWHRFFKKIPEETVEETRYYRHLPNAEWSQYLFPPSTHMVYGNRLLRKLLFDNSPAALRLWGFVLSEGERIYRARQAGMKVVAVMGDLGAVTPLVYSFPDTIAFYPDCLWWTPFLMESRVLFDEAAEYGLGDDCCFVRAALGAFSKKAYFPRPDLSIATVGATCDDMAAVISEAELIGNEIHYFELPHRNDIESDFDDLKNFLAEQYRELSARLEDITGSGFSREHFRQTVKKVNRLRWLIAECKRLCGDGEKNPMGAVEMMDIEFSALSYYGDLKECLAVLEGSHTEIALRRARGKGYSGQDIRLLWLTPPADPLLLNYAEELGGRIVGTEYIINQTTPLFNEEGDPFEILAENQLQASLMGSSDFRVKLILNELEKSRAEGAIISGVFGSSHCPYETVPIVNALRNAGIPTLAFDVVAPGKKRMQSQVFNRMEAFIESLRARRKRHAG